jgi:DNA-binding Lrp family transcriptional regulator
MAKDTARNARDQTLSIVMKLLKAKDESMNIKNLTETLGLSAEELLKLIVQLEEEKILRKARDDMSIVIPSGEERLRMAVKAVTLGASIEECARNLSWKEFESFCTKVLEENGYSCVHGLRFKSANGRRYECDIVALSKPTLLLADCKHYAGRVRALRSVVEKQLERADALNGSILTLMRRMSQLASWRETVIVPVIITLFPESIAFVDSVPVVPAFKLNQFIQELPSNIESVEYSKANPSKQRRLI